MSLNEGMNKTFNERYITIEITYLYEITCFTMFHISTPAI